MRLVPLVDSGTCLNIIACTVFYTTFLCRIYIVSGVCGSTLDTMITYQLLKLPSKVAIILGPVYIIGRIDFPLRSRIQEHNNSQQFMLVGQRRAFKVNCNSAKWWKLLLRAKLQQSWRYQEPSSEWEYLHSHISIDNSINSNDDHDNSPHADRSWNANTSDVFDPRGW